MSLLRDYAAAIAQPTLPLTGNGGRFDEVVGAGRRPAARLEGNGGDRGRSDPARTGPDRRRDHDAPRRRRRHLRQPGGRVAALAARSDAPRRWMPRPGRGWRSGSRSAPSCSNALLADIYGEQRLLSEGVIPAAVVFGHAGYTRPIVRARGFDPHPLILSSTDLGRDAAGEWRVLTDRVQAPSGLGYAMENRRVLSRVLPELYEEAGLHRMEPYFSALRSALLQAAPAEVADPRVVVAVARHALRDGVRPGVHREHPRLPARAGRGPRRPRRLGVDEARRLPAARTARARRRDPPPRRRRVVRPARTAGRVRGWASPVSPRRCGAGACASSTGSAPACSRTPA